jgi:hypothetical protein
MSDDELSGLLVVNRVLNEPLIHLLISLILHHLLHIFLNIWELFKNLLEYIPFESKSLNISFGDVILKNVNLLNDVIVVDNLSGLKIPFGRLILDDTIHDEVDILWFLSYLANVITFGESFVLEELQILGVEVIISILKESVDENGVIVQELGELCLQGRWKDLEEVRHLLVRLDLKFEVVAVEVGCKLLHQVLTNLELLIQLVDLLDSLLVHGVRSGDFTELRTQVTQNERENGDTDNDDEHGPNELIFVCR